VRHNQQEEERGRGEEEEENDGGGEAEEKIRQTRIASNSKVSANAATSSQLPTQDNTIQSSPGPSQPRRSSDPRPVHFTSPPRHLVLLLPQPCHRPRRLMHGPYGLDAALSSCAVSTLCLFTIPMVIIHTRLPFHRVLAH